MSSYVLVIEDEPTLRALVAETLRDGGHDVRAFGDAGTALGVAAAERPGVILLDCHAVGLDGPTFARLYRALPGPHAPIVLMTADADIDACAAAMRVEGALAKPFDLDELEATVARFCPSATCQQLAAAGLTAARMPASG